MNLGFQRVDITPHLPAALYGFEKERIAFEVTDPLYARIFLFQNAEDEMLWVQLDAAQVSRPFVEAVSEKTGIPGDKILICATHSHSAPKGAVDVYGGPLKGLAELFGPFNAEYCERAASLIAQAVGELRERLRPASLRILRGKIYGLGTDRRDPSLPGDDDVLILEFQAGGEKALILRMACQPAVLNAKNNGVSADFPGYIEPHFPEYAMCAFINGSCGNISTRFTRRGSGPAECRRFGKLCADAVRRILAEKQPVHTDFGMRLRRNVFRVKAAAFDPPAFAGKERNRAVAACETAKARDFSPKDLRAMEDFVKCAEGRLLMSRALWGVSEIEVPVSVLELPGLKLVFTPLELYSGLSNPLKRYGMEFVGCTNDYLMHMPDKGAFHMKSAHACPSPFAYGAGEELMERIREWALG